ncbi:MAG: bifunctional (p)ppGpp synthetase/guanosine-3',5'-bis(diphosphate) 3'-pyrophosphohydrolase, partial [Pseudomonadota bacterium]
MIRQFELVEKVRSYDPGADEDLINRAYVYSMRAHGHQTRASGDPYFSHPLEVAGLLAEFRLDSCSIATGLLHDVVEDTDAGLTDLRETFGDEVAQLVDGVTKLSKLELVDDKSKQAENFRKLVLAMSKDIRVLLVKLCDRLHNMRTLSAIKKEERRTRIALETLDIYAPLAERIGMISIKDELEDLAFLHLNPDARASIVARLEQLRAEAGVNTEQISEDLQDCLAKGGVEAQVLFREKRPYSIWRKMVSKDQRFEQLSDITAFRIIVGSQADCYQALGVLHDRYASLPDRFKDYISTPKPNGYQSIHNGIIGPSQSPIEVQIRTGDMHKVAEYGVAAHWAYKQGQPAQDGPEYQWLRELLDILEDAQRAEEFLEHTKMELFQDEVFCFTPKGRLITLPQGATTVDFAYAIHSDIGDTCVGARVNGRHVPLRHVLKNGDQVDIVTSKTQTPSPEWERFVVSGKARARIRRFIRTRQRDEYAELGRQIMSKLFRQEGYEFGDKPLERVLKEFRAPSVTDLLASVGAGLISSRDVFATAFPDHDRSNSPAKPQPEDGATVIPFERKRDRARKAGDPSIALRGLIPNMAVHFARCCHPIPGDRIVGIITTGKGVTIHTIDCETLESFHESPERWLDVSWDTRHTADSRFVGRVHAVLANEPG